MQALLAGSLPLGYGPLVFFQILVYKCANKQEGFWIHSFVPVGTKGLQHLPGSTRWIA